MSDSTAADAAVVTGPGPGPVLRAAREKRGMDEREVADLLNLPCRFVTAMEENQFDKLPADIFARGYLRAYARLLELDADEVIERYKQVVPREAPRVEPPRRARRGPLLNVDPGMMLVGVGALVLVVVAAGLWSAFATDGDDEGRGSGALPQHVQPPTPSFERAAPRPLLSQPADALPELQSAAAGDDLQQDGASDAAPVTGGDADVLSAAAIDTTASVVGPGAPADADVAALATTEPQSEAGGRRRGVVRDAGLIRVDTGIGDDRLVVRFREDCWTEISSADGAAIYQDLVQGDTELQVRGQAPFRILLGYAPGAAVSLNGQDVNLAPHTRDGVAIVVVGQ